MNSSVASRLKDAETATNGTADPAVPSSSSPPLPSLSSRSYTFSAEATPFIPSFMRVAPTAAAAAPMDESARASLPPSQHVTSEQGNASDEESDGKEDDSDENLRERFSKMWMLCLEEMQGHEVGMLMDMLPLDIQDLYFDKLSDEYLHHDHEHKDTGVHALRAAQKMVKELTPEQLVHIEDFLVETDALNADAKRQRGNGHLPHHGLDLGDEGVIRQEDGEEDENLFVNKDEGMGFEEEEWLLEQMMIAAGHQDEMGATKKRE